MALWASCRSSFVGSRCAFLPRAPPVNIPSHRPFSTTAQRSFIPQLAPHVQCNAQLHFAARPAALPLLRPSILPSTPTHPLLRSFVTDASPSLDEEQVDTIFHLSSGSSRAGVAVIRIAGPKAIWAYHQLTRKKEAPVPRMASMCTLYETSSVLSAKLGGSQHAPPIIDVKVLSLVFPSPKSYTGEDVVEFHVHGNPVIVQKVFRALNGLDGFRLADPGEFTKRAFMNGKLDLTQVEGLGDLISADTEAQHRQAVRQMAGDLGAQYATWRTQLVQALAHVEAVIDFAEDEADVAEEQVMEHVTPVVKQLKKELSEYLSDKRGEVIRNGINVAIVGPPNAGKSSLLNRLVQRSVAIVSEFPGTTRDIVEASINVGGWPVVLADTAGVRELGQGDAEEVDDEDAEESDDMSMDDEALQSIAAAEHIEAEGIRRAIERRDQADLLLTVIDASEFHNNTARFCTWMRDIPASMFGPTSVVVLNKIDKLPQDVALQWYARPQLSAGRLEQLRMEQAMRAAAHHGSAPDVVVADEAVALDAGTEDDVHQTWDVYQDAEEEDKKSDHEAPVEASAGHSASSEVVRPQGPATPEDIKQRFTELVAERVSVPCNPAAVCGVSVHDGTGMTQLLDTLQMLIEDRMSTDASGFAVITRERHRALTEQCIKHLGSFGIHNSRGDLVLAAEELRLAVRALGKVVGKVDVEELLDVIFRDFCIGK